MVANFKLAKKSYGPYQGVVDYVQDGDTVYCKLDLGFDITVYARVRILGINAPEISTEAGKEARTFARSVLPVGTPVKVVSFGWDKYGGRVDGTITLPDPNYIDGHPQTDFGNIMLISGHAEPYNP